jgi:hypothetical protein
LVWRSSWSSACVAIGPRQIMAWSGSTRKPIDITCTPWFSIGSIDWPSVLSGWPSMPIIMGWLGP